MTPGSGPQTEADNVWPPAVAHPPGFLPTVASDAKQRDLRRGRSALLSALSGIGLAALATGIGLGTLRVLQPPGVSAYLLDALLAIYLIGLICEVVAVVKGSIARKTRMGQWGLAISLVVLTAFILFIVSLSIQMHHNTGMWPWQGQSDDDCCHEKMGPDG